jgi:ribosome-binding protein aMBF1 (putative translation factor)
MAKATSKKELKPVSTNDLKRIQKKAHDFQKNFGRRIRDFRKTRGVTQIELARILGMHQAAISRLERGQQFPDMKSLFILNRLYGFRVDNQFEKHPN